MLSNVFRSSFPNVERSDFRTAAWKERKVAGPVPLELLHPTLPHALESAARLEQSVGITLLPDDEARPEEHRSYRQLYEQCHAVGARLLAKGLTPGERVLLVMPTSFDFIIGFFGVQLAGGIPVPSYPPAMLERAESALERLGHIARASECNWCLTDGQLYPLLGELVHRVKRLHELHTVESLLKKGGAPRPLTVKPGDSAFIQYTSGSTDLPKGVLINHHNLVSNCHATGLGLHISRTDRAVSWCPLYHDMGLIGGLLFGIYWRIPQALLSPMAFMLQPGRWLTAIQKHRGTLSLGPNFAYSLLVKRVRPSERKDLNLSSWRLALNGAEPVNLRSVQEFLDAFGPCGFRPESMYPVYGLAEGTLAVTFPSPGEPLRSLTVDRAQLAAGHVVEREGSGTMTVVCVGHPLPGHEVKVLDADGLPCKDRVVGHILTRGPSVMVGYFRNPGATEKVLQDGWLWTGDLGFFDGGGLFVTGRAKDLIIVRGKNFYASDLEHVAERVEGVRPGGTAAFGIYDEAKATDLVVLVCETKVGGEAERVAIATAVSEAISLHCGLKLDEVVLARPGSIPRTSSGKRQRSRCRERYLSGTLAPDRTGKLALAMVFVRSGTGFLRLLTRKLTRRRAPD